MNKTSVFDKLVRELSKKEREEFLEKIKMSFSVTDELLAPQDDEIKEVDLDQEYRGLGVLKKIIIFFQQIFTGKDYEELTELMLLKDLIRSIERKYPGVFNAQTGQLLQNMHDELESLRETVAPFKVPIDKSLGKNKTDFFAFLGSLELELIHEKLVMETDPFKREGEFSEKSDREVKEALRFSMDDVFAEMTETDREKMREHARSLRYLYEVSFFPYETIISRFRSNEYQNGLICPIKEVEDDLTYLANILYSFNYPPGARLFYALFLFQYQDEMENEDFELDEKIEKQMERAESGLNRIRQFNQEVPYIEILRYVKKNINYLPEVMGGGEDWYHLYRQFWNNRLEKLFRDFSMQRQKRNVIDQAQDFIGLEEFPKLQYYNSGHLEGTVKLKYEMTLAFLQALVEKVLSKELNRPLKVLLLDADFYKEQNRQEYTDAYNGLMQIPEQIQKVEYALTPSGDTGKALEIVKNEVIPPSLKRKKMQNILGEVDEEAEETVKTAQDNLHLLNNVLDGILNGDVGGKYDTISNVGYLGGKKSTSFLNDIEETLSRLKEAEELLASLAEVESST